MKKLSILFIMMLLLLMPACKKNAPAGGEVNADKNAKPAAVEHSEISPEEKARLLELQDKLKAEGVQIPPRFILSFEPLNVSENISMDDAAASFSFVKPMFRYCYSFAYAEDHEANGNVTITAKREGKTDAVATEIVSDIKVDGFEDCLRKKTSNWLIPPNSTVTGRVHFSSKPGLTAKEIEEIK